MAQNFIQANFIKGEVSPLNAARVDLEMFREALSQCENWIVHPEGGISARSGTRFVFEIKDSNKKARLVPFIYSTETNYVLEFGDQYIRVYKDQGIVTTADTEGTAPENPEIYEIVTTYTEEELFELQFAQSEDTLYIVHKDHKPAKLTRTSHITWTLADVAFTGTPTAWKANDYPQRITFYDGRLVLANIPSKPNTLWFSKSGEPEVLTVGTGNGDGMEFTIRAGQVNAIEWMAEDTHLLFGTSATTRTIGGSGTNTTLTPTDVKQRFHTRDGSAPIPPVQTGPVTIFAGLHGRKISEFTWAFENERFVAPELSYHSNHLLKSGIIEMTYVQNPFPIIWMCVGDGRLIGCTYNRDFKVAGWHQHTLGGDGHIESIAALQGVEHDELWMIVRRTLNGETKRYIEFLTPLFDGELHDKTDAVQVDSSLSYNGEPTSEFSGLDHLEGVHVSCLADGALDPDKEVLDGRITLQNARKASKAAIGFKYTAVARSLRLGVNDSQGNILGSQVGVKAVILDLIDTLLLKAGTSLTDLELIGFREGNDPMNSSSPLFTGTKRVVIDDDWSSAGQVYIVQDVPLPATVRAMIPATTV